MAAIRKSLLNFMFSGALMRRWNDKLRPIELYEIDKQGHKMIVAWILTFLNSKNFSVEEQVNLQQQVIEQGLFEYLFGLIVTDITPQVFHRICENPAHRKELTSWALNELKPIVVPLGQGFWERMEHYFYRTTRNTLADKIIAAAKLYSSGWEFSLIQPFNLFDEEANSIASSFIDRLENLKDIVGVEELTQGKNFFRDNSSELGKFAKLSGQLRFQIRWSGLHRTPETSVLGHMFLVAGYAYFCSLFIGACPYRCVNNFFSGLFHDLPELLTRDIVTPVKHSVNYFPKILKEYELQELESRVFGPLRSAGFIELVSNLEYYLGLSSKGITSEFQECIRTPSGVQRVSFDELQTLWNDDKYSPKDGLLIKACDLLAAFIEGHTSIRNGVAPIALYDAVVGIRSSLCELSFGPLSFDTIVADFD